MDSVLTFRTLTVFGIGKLQQKKVVALAVICMMVVFYLATFVNMKTDAEGKFARSSKKSPRKGFCEKRSSKFNSSLVRKDWDYKLFKRPEFLKNFKNPCFLQNVTLDISKTRTNQLRLRCLPYFLIAGFPKAGTTDLWVRLANHPDIRLRHTKEPKFFNIGRFKEGSFDRAAARYISILDRSAVEIHRLVAPFDCNIHPFPYYYGITGEGTVDTVFDNPRWKLIPGNEHCREPVVTNADIVHHMNPDIKIIFMVRNPVDRLYSDYLYESRYIRYPLSSQLFHEAVVDAIQNHTECRKYNSLRACAYNWTLETFKIRLRVGMYNIFISDWLKVFPHENILVVRSEDTYGPNREATYKRILQFLDLRPFTKLEEVSVFHSGRANPRTAAEKKVGDMLPETRALIEKFYEQFNFEFAKMYPDINYNAQKT